MDKRERRIIISTGQRGVGKSYTTFWSHIVPAVTEKKQKVLIIDVNDEYGKMTPNDEYSKKHTQGKSVVVRAIHPKDVRLFTKQMSPEIRRIRNINFDTGKLYKSKEFLDVIENAIEDFRGGLLLLEDIVAYMGNSMTQDIMSLIARNRHFDLDVVIHLQSVGMILPRLYQATNYIRFHKQLDSITKSKNKLVDLYELFLINEYILDYYYNLDERSYTWIDINNKKIIGCTDSEIIDKCIDLYLSQNGTEFSYLINQKNEKGKKVYSYKSAMDEHKKKIIEKYF